MVSILTSCLALLALSSARAVEPWKGGNPTIGDLWDEYSNIFPNNNRNAASHRWANFILERSAGLEVKVIEQLFRGFCAVSGSPVTPSTGKRYKYSLPKVAGGSLNGFVYHCCSPCVCDTQEFIRVDTKTVQTAAGPRKFNFQVVGNPCSSPLFNATYKALWQDPFNPSRKSSLAQSAPDVNCHDKNLVASVMSDNGNVIVGMLFDEEPDNFEGMQYTDVANQPQLQQFCVERKAAGYNSGMGVIFAKVANITRPQALTTTHTTTVASTSPPFLQAAVVTSTGKVEVKMTKAHADVLTKTPAKAKLAFASAIAKTIGVAASDVTVTAIYIDGVKVSGRRLADSVVKVEWTAKAKKAVVAANINAAALKTNIQTEAKAVANVDIKVTETPTMTSKAFENSSPVASAASSAQPMAVASFSCLWGMIVLYWLFINQFQ